MKAEVIKSNNMIRASSVETPKESKILSRKVTLEKENISSSANGINNLDNSSQTALRTPTNNKSKEDNSKLVCDKSVQTSSCYLPIMEANSQTIICASGKAMNASPASADAAMALSSLASRAPFPNARRNFSWGPPPPQQYYNGGSNTTKSVPPRKKFCSEWSKQRSNPSAKESCGKASSSSIETSAVFTSYKTPMQNPPNHSPYYPPGYRPLRSSLGEYFDPLTGRYHTRKPSPPPGQAIVSNFKPGSTSKRCLAEDENRHIVTPTPKKMKLCRTPAPEEQYSRKSKSLGLLCENFCKQEWPDGIIGIDGAASKLGVERRRIYDIINILESLEIVQRKCKNRYQWQGFKRLPEVLAQIQKEGVKDLEEEAREFGILKDSDPTDDLSSSSSDLKTSTGTKKSLGRLSRQFLQLFLVGHAVMSLTEASDRIMGKAEDAIEQPSQSSNRAERKAALTRGQKTKIRRLYDIANVLASIGLVQKVENPRKARPTFCWIYHWSAEKIRKLVTSPQTTSPNVNDTKSVLANIHQHGARESIGKNSVSKHQPSKLFPSSHLPR